jgi:hypothetical protein
MQSTPSDDGSIGAGWIATRFGAIWLGIIIDVAVFATIAGIGVLEDGIVAAVAIYGALPFLLAILPTAFVTAVALRARGGGDSTTEIGA